MAASDNGTMAEELDNRLDELFGEEDPAGAAPAAKAAPAAPQPKKNRAPATPQSAASDSPLKELSAIILSLDWEISEQNMTSLVKESARLQKQYASDQAVSTLLKLLYTAGDYVRRKLASAHPDSIQFIHAVYQGIDAVVCDPDLSPADRKLVLSQSLNGFNSLKTKIGGKSAGKAGTSGGSDALKRYIVQVVRKVVQSELESFKTEIRAMVEKR